MSDFDVFDPRLHHGPYICAVCRRGLEHEVDFGRRGTGEQVILAERWVHNGAYKADHEPVPLTELDFDDQVSVCDFCNELHPTWDFDCESFESPLPPRDGATRSYGSVEGWLACDACKEDLCAESPAIDRMWVRWLEHHAEDMAGTTPAERRHLRDFAVGPMWSNFLANRRGEPRRILTGTLPPEP